MLRRHEPRFRKEWRSLIKGATRFRICSGVASSISLNRASVNGGGNLDKLDSSSYRRATSTRRELGVLPLSRLAGKRLVWCQEPVAPLLRHLFKPVQLFAHDVLVSCVFSTGGRTDPEHINPEVRKALWSLRDSSILDRCPHLGEPR